jgi:CheY-like chemotaxis protein
MTAERAAYARGPCRRAADPPRFLVVDDELEGRALVSGIILSRYPAAVIREASSNAEAFLVLLDFEPDIIVTELSRWGGAGYEFLRKLRQCPRMAETPVVLSSRRGRDADAFGISADGLHEAACRHMSQEAMMAALFALLLTRVALEVGQEGGKRHA